MTDLTHGLLGALLIIGIDLVLVGAPVFVLAHRRGVAQSWRALLPVVTFWVLGECGERTRRERAALVALCGLGLPVAQGLISGIAGRLDGQQGEAAALQTGLELGLAAGALVVIVAAVVVWLATWDAVCQVTGQSSKKVWLFFVPFLGLLMPWAIALMANPRQPRRAPAPTGATGSPQASRMAALDERKTTTIREKVESRSRAKAVPRPPAWLLGDLVLVVLFGALLLLGGRGLVSGDGHRWEPTTVPSTPTPEPDRVVNILSTCDFLEVRAAQHLICAQAVARGQAINHRKEITVRTFSGSTYTVTVRPDTYVTLKVGDTFP